MSVTITHFIDKSVNNMKITAKASQQTEDVYLNYAKREIQFMSFCLQLAHIQDPSEVTSDHRPRSIICYQVQSMAFNALLRVTIK